VPPWKIGASAPRNTRKKNNEGFSPELRASVTLYAV
jgi:hypothetical protein